MKLFGERGTSAGQSLAHRFGTNPAHDGRLAWRETFGDHEQQDLAVLRLKHRERHLDAPLEFSRGSEIKRRGPRWRRWPETK
jgi:hypothetical protein